MTADPVERIAHTVLYEGYLLYPYRRSAVKNRQRFNFGVLYPAAYCDEHPGSDAWRVQAECPVRGAGNTRVEVSVRFLQLFERPGEDGRADTWQEVFERRVQCELETLTNLQTTGTRLKFGCAPLQDAAADGELPLRDGRKSAGDVILGELQVKVVEVRPGHYKMTLSVANRSELGREATRDEALLRSMTSAHVVARVVDGEFISLLDPPDQWRDITASCANVGLWPALVGEPGSSDCVLAAPIILYDHPQIAPESAGDLFDGTEIDEILALRILTMTDEEKREARGSDARAREILDRTEGLGAEHFARLHGAVRGLRRVTGGPT